MLYKAYDILEAVKEPEGLNFVCTAVYTVFYVIRLFCVNLDNCIFKLRGLRSSIGVRH